MALAKTWTSVVADLVVKKISLPRGRRGGVGIGVGVGLGLGVEEETKGESKQASQEEDDRRVSGCQNQQENTCCVLTQATGDQRPACMASGEVRREEKRVKVSWSSRLGGKASQVVERCEQSNGKGGEGDAVRDSKRRG